MILENGTGVTGADSYADPAEASVTAYIDSHLYPEAWTAATPLRRTAAVMQATRLIDTYYEWRGYRATVNQGLSWPR